MTYYGAPPYTVTVIMVSPCVISYVIHDRKSSVIISYCSQSSGFCVFRSVLMEPTTYESWSIWFSNFHVVSDHIKKCILLTPVFQCHCCYKTACLRPVSRIIFPTPKCLTEYVAVLTLMDQLPYTLFKSL